NLQGEFNLNKGNFEARGVLADILNGQVTAAAKIENLQGTPSGHFTASAKSLSIEAAKSALKGANLAQAPVDGSMDLSLVGAWTKGLDTLKAHSDLAVKGSLASTAAAKRSRVPLSASAHVDYDGGRALATLR